MFATEDVEFDAVFVEEVAICLCSHLRRIMVRVRWFELQERIALVHVPVLTHLVKLLFCERHERVDLFRGSFEVFDGESVRGDTANIEIKTYLK